MKSVSHCLMLDYTIKNPFKIVHGNFRRETREQIGRSPKRGGKRLFISKISVQEYGPTEDPN